MHSRRAQHTGFTLIEMMIVVVLGAVILTLAAPSFRNLILVQRLKSINSQVVTDLAFARSEAISRGVQVQVAFKAATASSPSCYVFYTHRTNLPAMCDCAQPEGFRCTADAANTQEIRTVQVPADLSVFINPVPSATFPNTYFAYDPRTGGMFIGAVDVTVTGALNFVVESSIDATRKYRNTVAQSGRTTVCVPSGSTVTGDPC